MVWQENFQKKYANVTELTFWGKITEQADTERRNSGCFQI